MLYTATEYVTNEEINCLDLSSVCIPSSYLSLQIDLDTFGIVATKNVQYYFWKRMIKEQHTKNKCIFRGKTTKRGGGGRNLLNHWAKLHFFQRRKDEKKYEPLRSRGGYLDLSGSTTKKTNCWCVFPTSWKGTDYRL